MDEVEIPSKFVRYMKSTQQITSSNTFTRRMVKIPRDISNSHRNTSTNNFQSIAKSPTSD